MADETNSPRAPSTGIEASDMQDYLSIDGDEDVLRSLIEYAEEDARGSIDSSIDIEVYRKFPIFNQAVRTLVDFNYYNRGALSGQQIAYPKSYQYMLNKIRWKVGKING
ncbi:head-tail connector protein [Leuconostoc citreum]|uniref:head-tail connector protein n=1 Tax=Leuconostoc citreum TaxID=33964 RepID=UPI001060960F|nr:head-tail connector protein [Leuconostoc citreum]MCS8582913.1 phage gp6-like head-tail connector protein [Leuconostoc citreum]MCS8601274.1 phage gp6-like head-tail connector protein [Leuconostoc citreum]MCT3072527.1 phage gp6-like head-tail connector protein [Leuconostoc citreum]TDM36243.1 DNA packaging-like protein [Leuconostoc citreum]TPF03030.1 DNA packaging-like protein [Leuconostoc citreum]